ncbi:MAG: tetratricopeptide repeat protein, partial [Deltaproteobacteria bacterium]|nr:tetratricopeptide repeat protein [Deltaproteobacteria bacterium]
ILDTYVVLPSHQLELTIRLPLQANRLPDLALMYGLRVVVDERVAWVLFGDKASSGELDDGTAFVMLPAPRGRWSRRRVDLEAILLKLGFDLAAKRVKMPRFDHIDVPFVPINFQLAWMRRRAGRFRDAESAADGQSQSAFFGPVRTLGLRPDKSVLFARARRRPHDLQVWLAAFNFEARNYEIAVDHYTAATQMALNSHPAWLGLGDAQLWLGRWERAAVAYEHAIALRRKEPLAYKGLGWARLNQEHIHEAQLAWRRALQLLQGRGQRSESAHLGDVHRGLALAQRVVSSSQVDPSTWAWEHMHVCL